MLVKNAKANMGFLQIMQFLKELRRSGLITKEEYDRGEAYYRRLTKAEIIVLYDEEAPKKEP